MKYLLIGIVVIWSSILYAHPDGAKPFWYPSSYIFGFVNGCSNSIEQSQALAGEMWPTEIQNVCGCVVDSMRHSLTLEEASLTDNKSTETHQMIVNAVMPICINQERMRKANADPT